MDCQIHVQEMSQLCTMLIFMSGLRRNWSHQRRNLVSMSPCHHLVFHHQLLPHQHNPHPHPHHREKFMAESSLFLPDQSVCYLIFFLTILAPTTNFIKSLHLQVKLSYGKCPKILNTLFHNFLPKFSFLVRLYKSSARAIALPPVSVSALTKCFTSKFFKTLYFLNPHMDFVYIGRL